MNAVIAPAFTSVGAKESATSSVSPLRSSGSVVTTKARIFTGRVYNSRSRDRNASGALPKMIELVAVVPEVVGVRQRTSNKSLGELGRLKNGFFECERGSHCRRECTSRSMRSQCFDSRHTVFHYVLAVVDYINYLHVIF